MFIIAFGHKFKPFDLKYTTIKYNFTYLFE